MRYCTRCLYPETKPDIWFNKDGLCSACIAYDARKEIDWKKREQDFAELADNARRNRGAADYDCIIPVSGGKDSHFQVIKALEHGLKPLAVCASTCDLSDIGRANLNNIANLCDLQEVTPNIPVRKKLNKYALEKIGDISWPEHQLIFTVPYNVAAEKDIGLILYGENPQNEYGGPKEKHQTNLLDEDWLSEFGGLNGLRVNDLIGAGVINSYQAAPYIKGQSDMGVKSLFVGYYFPWDGMDNAIVAMAHGFRTLRRPVEGCGYEYENLDNLQTGIHDYFKYLKFGFGRATDLANNHLRRGRITRGEAIEIIEYYDGAYPSTYLGVPLERTLNKIGMHIDEFLPICDKFTNKKLFDLPNRSSRRLRPSRKFDLPCSRLE